MRLEDKELEGPELEREQRLEVLEEQSLENDRELPLATEAIVDPQLDHRSRLFDALELILAGEHLNVALLYLPQRETLALEALQAAVTGRDQQMNTFVFAEDRASLLEQALAVLQQNLTYGDPATLAALEAKYDALTTNIAELRDQLLNLEDAQDDLLEMRHDRPQTFAPETDDAPAPTVDDPRPEHVSTLADGPAAKPREYVSALGGPEVKQPELVSTLTGKPEAKPREYVSALGGPEPKQPEWKSTLDAGPAVKPREHASTVGDPADRPLTSSFDPAPQTRKVIQQAPQLTAAEREELDRAMDAAEAEELAKLDRATRGKSKDKK